jgi:hypothetical protein
MHPTLTFRAVGKSQSLIQQTSNLEKWWKNYQEKIYDALDRYVNIQWKIYNVRVVTQQIKKRGSAYDCEGEVDIASPNVISLHLGNRIRWTPRNLVVFIHELIHCATIASEDRRFNEPGVLEFWIYDEFATDLLAQYVLKDAGIKYKPKILDSFEYAFLEISRKLMKSRQHREERVQFVKDINRKLLSYLKTTSKNFYSFRKMLKTT